MWEAEAAGGGGLAYLGLFVFFGAPPAPIGTFNTSRLAPSNTKEQRVPDRVLIILSDRYRK